MKKIITVLTIGILLAITGCASGDTTNDKTPMNATINKDTDTSVSYKISVDQKELFDANGIKATLIEYDDNHLVGPSFKILIENNSTKTIGVICDSLIVNGYMVMPFFSAEIAEGKKANEYLDVPRSSLKDSGIAAIKSVTAYFHMFDTSTYESYGSSVMAEWSTKGAEDYVQKYDDSGFEIFNQKGVRGVIKRLNSSDSFWGADLYIYVENNSGKDLTISAKDISANGFMLNGIYSAEIKNGTKSVNTMTFFESDMNENDIKEITDLEAVFYGFDSFWDNYFETQVVRIDFTDTYSLNKPSQDAANNNSVEGSTDNDIATPSAEPSSTDTSNGSSLSNVTFVPAKNVVDSIKNANPGDIIRLGKYEQDNDPSDKEDIEWIVLEKVKSGATIVSLYGLDHVNYKDVNLFLDSFYRDSFTSGEKETILDYYIMDYIDAERLFESNDERKCETTPYAVSKGVHVYDGENVCWWWLDTADISSGVHTVRTDGHIKYVDTDPNATGYAIRPTLKISIK